MTPRVKTAGGAAILAVLFAVVSTVHVGDGARPRDGQTARAASCADTKPLVDLPQHCHVMRIGDRRYRYAFIPAADETDRTVILDPGGPGTSALASGWLRNAGAQLASGPLSGYNAVVIEEPWVTAPVESSCDAAMRAYYVRAMARSSIPTSNPDVFNACHLDQLGRYAYDATTYGRILDSIEREHHVLVVAMMAESFGVARRLYVASRPMDWTILVRPFPIAASAAELLTQRAASASALRMRVASSRLAGISQARRLPVTAADVTVARLAMATHGATPHNTDEVARASDGFWRRYGRDQISPAILAFWQETCPTKSRWPQRPWNGSTGDLEGMLVAIHGVCARSSLRPLPPVATIKSDRICTVLSPTDSVAPGRLSEGEWQSAGALIVRSSIADHTSQDGVQRCLRWVLESDAAVSKS